MLVILIFETDIQKKKLKNLDKLVLPILLLLNKYRSC